MERSDRSIFWIFGFRRLIDLVAPQALWYLRLCRSILMYTFEYDGAFAGSKAILDYKQEYESWLSHVARHPDNPLVYQR